MVDENVGGGKKGGGKRETKKENTGSNRRPVVPSWTELNVKSGC